MEGFTNDGRCTQSSFTISNPCRYNTLSKSGSGLADQTYGFSSTASTLYPSSFLSTSVSTSTCPLTYTYYIWSDTYDNWIEQSSNSAPFSAFDTSDGALTVYTTDSGIFSPSTATAMSYQVKWVITDPMSESDDNSIEEIFNLSVEDLCASNELYQSGTLEDVLHYIQGATTTVTPSAWDSTTCAWTCQLFFYDAPNYTWEEYTSATASTYPFVSSFDTSYGTLSISTSDYTNYENYSVRTKIVLTDERSSSSLNSIEDEFDLYIRDQCRDVTINTGISGFTGTEATPYYWHMWQAQSISFTGVSISVSGCPESYTITQDNAERTEETAVYTITEVSTGSYTLTGTWTDGEVSTRFYYIQGKVYNMLGTEQVAIDEAEYWINVSNPCLRSDSITSQSITDLDYWIKDSAESVTFTDF